MSRHHDLDGVWPERTREQVIGEWLWLEYLVATERYDMQVCTSVRYGEAFPRTPYEHRAITRNATIAYAWVRRLALREGIVEPRQHRSHVERLSFADQVHLLPRARQQVAALGVDWRGYTSVADWGVIQ